MTDNELAVELLKIDAQLRDLPNDYYDLNGMSGSAEKPAVQAIRKEITKWVDILELTND